MEQQLIGFLRSLKGNQLTSSYLIEGFKKLVLSNDLSQQLIGFVNNQLFTSNQSVFHYIQPTIKSRAKDAEETRAMVYGLLADYIKLRGDRLIDYVHIIVTKFQQFYSQEQSSKPKQITLKVLGRILKYVKHTKVMEQSIKPKQFSQFLIRQLKMFKPTPTLRGALWYLLSLIYIKFPEAINNNTKQEIQETLIKQLQTTVNSDKNLSTIAKLVKSLSLTLEDNFLEHPQVTKYFNYLTVLSIPLKSTFDVPKSALKALTKNAQFFYENIMDNAKNLFQSLLKLMSHHNKQLKNRAGQALEAVNIQIVKGICHNPGRYEMLYNQMLGRLWEIIRQKVPNLSPQQQKTQSQAGKMATVLKVIGDLAPTIVKLSGSEQLGLMFSKLIEILDSKTMKSFSTNEHQMSQAMKVRFEKASSFVYILYNQKLICSYLSAFGKVLPYLDELSYFHMQRLQNLWLLGIKQYPFYYEKYIPLLFSSFVEFLIGFSSRKDIFQKWLNRILLRSLKQTLDLNRFTIGSSENYYQMIRKAFEIWNSLLIHTKWASHEDSLAIFKDVVFDCFEYQLRTLDISYKKPTQEDQSMNEVDAIFSGLGKLFQATNVPQYQYMYSLTLVFEHLLLKLNPEIYESRLYNFYMQILRRFKYFQKSIPLMKLSRSLNDYITRTQYFSLIPEIQKKQLIISIHSMVTEIFGHLQTFESVFLYDGLKMLMSTPLEVMIHNRYKILRTQMPVVILKALDLGQQTPSLAYTSIKCLQRLFLSKQRKNIEKYLSILIPQLEKYLSYKKNEEITYQDPNLSLWELSVTKILMLDECLLFLGKLGGNAHLVVPKFRNSESKHRVRNDGFNINQKNVQNGYISWDYEASLYFPLPMTNLKLDLNITKLLPRLCHLMINSPLENIKITASELMHAVIIYIIGKSASNPKKNNTEDQKSNQNSFKKLASKIYQKILPFVFKVSCNQEHPSNELMKTLSIQLVRFLSNTQQPDSPDILVIISLLLQLLSCSQDLSTFSSKCLVQLIKYNLKQSPNKQYPLFKMLMRNVWPLALSRKPGCVTLMTQILRVVYKQSDIMLRYLLEFFSIVLTLSKTNSALSIQFRYLLDKLILSLKNYVTLLKINERQNTKFKTITQLLNYLYSFGFTSIFSQQRQVSFILWQQILLRYGEQLNITVQNFLFVRAVESKMLFGGNLVKVDFYNFYQQEQLIKNCSKLDGQTQLWTRMTEKGHFRGDRIVLFKDFSTIYMPSIKQFFQLLDSRQFNSESIKISIETTDCILQCFLKCINLFWVLLQHSDDEQTIPSIISQTVSQVFFLRILSIMFLKPQTILQRINYDILVTQFRDSFKTMGKVFKSLASPNYFASFQSVLSDIFNYTGSPSLIQILMELNSLYEIQLQVYLLGQAEINNVISSQEMSLKGAKWVDSELKSLISIVKSFNQNDQKSTSTLLTKQKLKIFINFILSHENERVAPFVTKQLISNSKLYQIFQKQFVAFIVNHWDQVGSEIVSVSLQSLHVAKILFGLVKFLNVKQSTKLSMWLQSLKNQRNNSDILQQELKLSFLLIQQISITQQFLQYQNFLIKKGMDPNQSLRIHESTLNIIALLSHIKSWMQVNFSNVQKMLLNLLDVYMLSPTSILKDDRKQRYISFLKVIKSFLTLSQNIHFFSPLLPIFINHSFVSSFKQLNESIVQQFITNCFLNKDPLIQAQSLQWVLNMFLDDNLDKKIEGNKRIVLVQMFVKRMITVMTSIQTIHRVFENNIKRLLPLLVLDPFISNQNLILKIQIKSMVFHILQCFYKVFPPKRTHEELHKNDYHRGLIIDANETLKSQFKHQSILQAIDEQKKYTFQTMDFLRELWCQAYNLLIVLFICTQKNKEHFKGYLFDKKQGKYSILWEHLVDPLKTEMGFQITTDFKIMKPLERVCKPLKSKIKNQYMSSSLFVIDEQLVPKTQLEDAVMIQDVYLQMNSQNYSNKEKQTSQSIPLQLDIINQHPCMNNLLVLVDFLHSFFKEQGTPSWMIGIYEQLNNPDCPLAVQIFLIKLIINRPSVFSQDIWLSVLIKYLGMMQNGSKFFHYFYRDVAKQAISYLEMGYKIQGKPVCMAINKMLTMLPHPQNPYLFSDNITIMQRMLEQRRVYIDQKIISKMLSFEEGKQNYLQWRMTAVIVLKICLMEKVPILSSYEQFISLESSMERFKYFHKLLDSGLAQVTKLFTESKQKYSIASAGLLGQILKSMDEIGLSYFSSNLKQMISIQLSNLAIGKTRVERERFCLIINQVCQIYPLAIQISRINSFAQDALYSSNPKDRVYILECYQLYFQYQIKTGTPFFETLEGFCVTIRGCIDRIALDGPQVHFAFLESICHLINPAILSEYFVFQMFFHIFPVIQKTYLNKKKDLQTMLKYFEVVICIDKFLNENSIQRFREFNKSFKVMTNTCLIKGLSSSQEDLRAKILSHLQQFRDRHPIPSQRLLHILKEIYIPSSQQLWLVTAVPLILSLTKQTSDYQRVLFEQSLDNLAVYYDWDFRKGFKNHVSQPYTPAYTLNTQFIKKEVINQMIANQSQIQNMEGLIKASSDFDGGQSQPLFTQIQMSNSFNSDIPASQLQNSQPQVHNIFRKDKRKSPAQMSRFMASNALVYNKFSVVGGNRFRFGKPDQTKKDKQHQLSKQAQAFMGRAQLKQKSTLLRKYKLGELPDIQIKSKDIIDPLIQLSFCDEEFASQLIGLIFQQMCRKQKSSVFVQKFKQALPEAIQRSTKCTFMFISCIQKLLTTLCKETGGYIFFDMKSVAESSNSYDYSILFTEQNLIQMQKSIDLEEQIEINHRDNSYGSSKRQRATWLDLLQLYHKMNEDDNLLAILDKIMISSAKNQLSLAFKLKDIGDLVMASDHFSKLKDSQSDSRIKELILGEYLQCETLLGNWDKVGASLQRKSETTPLTKNQSKVLTTALLASDEKIVSESLKIIDFKKHCLFYEQAILSLCMRGIIDTPKYLLKQQINSFIESWNRVSAFALKSKHQLIQLLQKTHQFYQFLQLFDEVGITLAACKQMFVKWTERSPSAIHDSHITSLQILEARKKYAKLMADRFSISDTIIIKNTADWMVQQANLMVKKGSFGSAEHLIKSALLAKRTVDFFSWNIYKATGKLKLKQLMMEANTQKDVNVLSNFQQLPNLILREMNNSKNIPPETYIHMNLLKVKFYQGFIELYEQRVSQPSCPHTLIGQYTSAINNAFKLLVECYRSQLINTPMISNQMFKIKRKIYITLTCFCQKVFSMLEGNSKIDNLKKPLNDMNMTLDSMTQLFGGGLIKSLNLIGFGEEKGQIKKSDYKICFLILKFLKVVQLKSVIMGQLFMQMIQERRVPIWIFLHFIPQFISALSLPTSKYFGNFFMVIAQQYPEALIYQFNSQFQDRSHCITPQSKNIYDFLHQKYHSHYTLIQALDSLNHPQLRLQDALGMCMDKATANDGLRQLKLLVDDQDQYKGQYTRKFAKDWKKDIGKLIDGLEKKANVTDIIKNINQKVSPIAIKIEQGYNKLSNFSTFFQSYAASDIERFGLMTEPYRLGQQPLKQMKVYIESFDQSILTLGSLRRPKRLTMFGNNQKKYSVLVKGGEDLRLDQRIEQIFSVMNIILLKDVDCEKRQHFIRRYEVVPIKKTVGLLEWVDDTKALRDFLQKQQIQITGNQKLDLFRQNDAYRERLKFLQSMTKQKGNLELHLPLLIADDNKVIFTQNKIESLIPYGLLRRGIQKLARSYDSFLHLKNRFISNYAVACAVCYIIGIGDRHLDNFLIHIPSATIILIDFGRSFDYVVDLRMPQLMPFRLTKCFRELTEPVGVFGSFKTNLTFTLKALRNQHEQILDFAQIFISDPVLDWIKVSRKKQSKIAITSSQPNFSQSQEMSKQQRQFFSMKIQTVKRKLQGYHPRMILMNLLKDTVHKNKNYLPTLLKAILKDRKINPHQVLSLEQQAQELINMAIDPNIVGRVYTGWEPWV